MNCFVHRWFCVVRGPKPLLHHHNWLSFGKFQDTEHFLIPCPHHVSSQLPPSGETCKYATAPMTQKKIWGILYLLICSSLDVTIPATVPQRSEIPEGLMKYPVLYYSIRNRYGAEGLYPQYFNNKQQMTMYETCTLCCTINERWMLHNKWAVDFL
jgi:hypothetical protein